MREDRQGCFSSMPELPSRSRPLLDVSRVFQGSFKKIKGSFMHITRKLKGCVKSVPKVFQEIFIKISKVF